MAEGLSRWDCEAGLVKWGRVRAPRKEGYLWIFSSGSNRSLSATKRNGSTGSRPWFGACHGTLPARNICGPICSKDEEA
jgi:hypothetical protein